MKKFLDWIPAIFIMLVIFFLSSIPGESIDATVLGYEKVQVSGHFILFTFLCFSYFKATKNVVLSIFLTLLYAISDEIHQSFTPGRSSSLKDIGVDMIGALISGLFIWKILPTLPKKLKDLLLK